MVIEEVFSSSNIILPLDDVESVVPNAKSVMLSNQITEISKLVIDEASTSKMKTECEIVSGNNYFYKFDRYSSKLPKFKNILENITRVLKIKSEYELFDINNMIHNSGRTFSNQ